MRDDAGEGQGETEEESCCGSEGKGGPGRSLRQCTEGATTISRTKKKKRDTCRKMGIENRGKEVH